SRVFVRPGNLPPAGNRITVRGTDLSGRRNHRSTGTLFRQNSRLRRAGHSHLPTDGRPGDRSDWSRRRGNVKEVHGRGTIFDAGRDRETSTKFGRLGRGSNASVHPEYGREHGYCGKTGLLEVR